MGGNNNLYNEKTDIINFIRKQLENNVDNLKGMEYIIRVFQLFTKGYYEEDWLWRF
jgi:hypothetical protein